MPHRIEIRFVGKAPADELARAKILGSEAVHQAIEKLKTELADAGLECEVSAQTIRTGQRPGNSGRPRIISPSAAAE